MIKAVLFDVDGVLLDSFEANLKFFQNLISGLGHRPPTREEYSQMFHIPMREVIKKFTNISSEEELNKICQIRAAGQIQYPIELLEYPDQLEEVIQVLKQDYILGIVTSRIRGGIFEAPRLLNLKEHFSVVVVHEDTEKHKPEPEPLLFAAKKLGVKPVETVYIGDLPSDLQAAKSAGMKVIIYSKDKFVEADACTDDFKTLPELIKKL
ncbi:MAG: HAD family hydrolase [Patescibacteria group bacterium]